MHNSKKIGKLLDARVVRPADEATIENLYLDAGYTGKEKKCPRAAFRPSVRRVRKFPNRNAIRTSSRVDGSWNVSTPG
jgi:hypothetical protein